MQPATVRGSSNECVVWCRDAESLPGSSGDGVAVGCRPRPYGERMLIVNGRRVGGRMAGGGGPVQDLPPGPSATKQRHWGVGPVASSRTLLAFTAGAGRAPLKSCNLPPSSEGCDWSR